MKNTIRIKRAKLYGTSAIEYALVLAIIVALILGASNFMKNPITELFQCAAQKVISLITGGSYECEGGLQKGGPDDNDDSADPDNPDDNQTPSQPDDPTDDEQANWPSPTGQGERACDGQGCGHFGAPRGNRNHHGIDYVATGGQDAVAVIGGEITRIGWPYANADYRYIEITTDDGYVVREMYIAPDADLQVGSTVIQGQVIGTVQSLQPRYPGITDHVHLEVRHNGVVIDPSTVIGAN